jgi:hypothetical protein
VFFNRYRTTQISKLLQEAKVLKIASTQLDLQLVKIHAKLSNQKAVSHGFKSPVITKTGTMAVIPMGKGKASIGANVKTDPSSINNASFLPFIELLKTLTVSSSLSASGGVTPSSPAPSPMAKSVSSPDHNGNSVLEKLAVYFRELILKKDGAPYEIYVLESKISLSGVLSRTLYSNFLHNNSRVEQIHSTSSRLHWKLYSEHEIDLVRQVWERNLDQIRIIYHFYAAALESRRMGSGALQLLMSVENCKEMLQDFQLLPQLIDMHVSGFLFLALFPLIFFVFHPCLELSSLVPSM